MHENPQRLIRKILRVQKSCKWVGGQPRYKVRIEGLGIVCEDLATAFCKFGPLKSKTSELVDSPFETNPEPTPAHTLTQYTL